MNAYEIIRISNKHPRVNILSPGPGVGGRCVSVELWFLVGIYGLTYKENVNDMRESPTLQMLESMAKHLGNGVTKIYDSANGRA